MTLTKTVMTASQTRGKIPRELLIMKSASNEPKNSTFRLLKSEFPRLPKEPAKSLS